MTFLLFSVRKTFPMGWTDVFSRKKTVKKETFSAEAITSLRQAMNLLETAFDATADGLLIVSGPGKVAGFNRPFAKHHPSIKIQH